MRVFDIDEFIAAYEISEQEIDLSYIEAYVDVADDEFDDADVVADHDEAREAAAAAVRDRDGRLFERHCRAALMDART